MIFFVIVDGCMSSTGLSLTIVVAIFTLLNYKEKNFMSLMMKIWCLNHELQGICEGFKAKRNPTIPSRYKEGQKRCSVCEIFVKWDETYCPCCNYKLKTRSFRGWEMRKD